MIGIFNFVVFVSFTLAMKWDYLALNAGQLDTTLLYVSLAGIIFSFVVAKRRIEMSKHLLYAEVEVNSRQFVLEKVKRFEAEFECDRLQSKRCGLGSGVEGGGLDVASLDKASFCPSSSVAFQAVPSGDAEDDLQRIAAFGRREHWVIDAEHLVLQPMASSVLIDAEDLVLQPHCILGSGGFGIVVAGTFVGSPVAVKIARHRGAKNGLAALANEIRVLRHVRHPNLALFHGVCFDTSKGLLVLVLERIQGQSLTSFVDRGAREGTTEEPTTCQLLLGICRALMYLHSREPCIIHGDLKPGNIMVERFADYPRAKLLDFGLSRLLTRRAKPLGGTTTWMAPEVMQRSVSAPTVAADTYSFGQVAFYSITGQTPHVLLTHQMIQRLLVRRQVPSLSWPKTPFAARSKGIIDVCTSFDHKLRPAMSEVHQHIVAWLEALGLPDTAGSGVEPLHEAVRRLASDHVPPSQQQQQQQVPRALQQRHGQRQEQWRRQQQQQDAAQALQVAASTAPSRAPPVEESASGPGQEPAVRRFRPTPTRTRAKLLLQSLLRMVVEEDELAGVAVNTIDSSARRSGFVGNSVADPA
eukprot:CAMPEP_0115679034 /NCGR_PEP_ID=MMETSP0272-20121206/56073_1 /TAXON_ID=71861 /ORGANISM="Scrippsiella trochoidea, Strain CCMP3099" /LENGTH=582 /DNA_ID=CAMNT_0003118251 /DNA_START=65 /DNA_END=1811 /DNA_ORIENTATION=-